MLHQVSGLLGDLVGSITNCNNPPIGDPKSREGYGSQPEAMVAWSATEEK